MNILIKWPTRGRANIVKPLLKKWRDLLSGKHDVMFVFSVDHDDVETIKALDIANSGLHLFYTIWSPHPGEVKRTKISAINADINNLDELRAESWVWDILILTSDDMVPQVKDLDDLIATRMMASFPDLDGVLHYNDGYRGRQLNTLPIMGRTYYERFRYVYHPSYITWYADNEFQDVSEGTQRAVYINEVLIRHAHPYNDKSIPDDDTYRRSMRQEDVCADRVNYRNRIAAGVAKPLPSTLPDFVHRTHAQYEATMLTGQGDGLACPDRPSLATGEDLARELEARRVKERGGLDRDGRFRGRDGSPRPVLSILIPTLTVREKQFMQLTAELSRQQMTLPDPLAVEVLWISDNKEMPLPEKRNKLLAMAAGDYVCYIDDDDWVSPDYMISLLGGLKRTAELPNGPDCVTYRGKYFANGHYSGIFDFDLAHTHYKDVGAMHLRTPNHLTPVRIELARSVQFPNKCPGEDFDYALRLKPLLKTQHIVKDSAGNKKYLYEYRFSSIHTQTQRK